MYRRSKTSPRVCAIQINNRYAGFEEVALVCHSLGGLIARKYLIDEIKNRHSLRVRRLILCAVPNDGAQLASIAQFLSWKHNQLKQLCRDSDLIEFLNDDWATHKLDDAVSTKLLIGTQDQVVDRASARGHWRHSHIETITGRNHVNLVKPTGADDDAFLTLKRLLLEPNRESSPSVESPIVTARVSESLQIEPTEARVTTQPSESVPVHPLRCIGRNEETKNLVDALREPKDFTAVLVLGSAGMGKTTITREVATYPNVVGRYGQRRWFVELETAPTRETVETAILSAIGLDPATVKFDAALTRFGEAPSLLVLDNLETPWDGEREKVEALLGTLHAVPGLAILASIRGNEPPGGLRWSRQRTMHPLEWPHDRDLFIDIAQDIKPDDPDLAPLLKGLGGVPLAIELVALEAAVHDTLAAVLEEWRRVGIALANRRGVAPTRLSSLEVSLELSFNSKRLGDAGRRLFCLLGQLPAGVADEDLKALLGEAAFSARRELLSTGRALQRGTRLDLLPPVRDHASRLHPPSDEDADRLRKHYLYLVRDQGEAVGKAGGSAAVTRLTPELANIDAAMRRAVDHGMRADAIAAVHGLSRLIMFTGLGTAGGIQSLASACSVAEDAAGEALCLDGSGDIALARSDHDAARRAYEQALTLYRQIGNILGEANCIWSLGDIALRRSDHAIARKTYEQALTLYRQVGGILGEANCIAHLGDIALHRSDDAAARKAYEQALPLFRQFGDILGEANCIRNLGDIALDRSDHDAARKAYEQALPLFRQVGQILGEANCIQSLGDVALARFDHDEARNAYEQALPLYRQVGQIVGEANCIMSLGDIAFRRSDHDAARKAYEQALPLYRQIGQILGEANCIKSLGNIALARADRDAARIGFAEALGLYEKIEEPYSIGHAHQQLAMIAKGKEREKHLAAARAAWTSIGRDDLVEQFIPKD